MHSYGDTGGTLQIWRGSLLQVGGSLGVKCRGSGLLASFALVVFQLCICLISCMFGWLFWAGRLLVFLVAWCLAGLTAWLVVRLSRRSAGRLFGGSVGSFLSRWLQGLPCRLSLLRIVFTVSTVQIVGFPNICGQACLWFGKVWTLARWRVKHSTCWVHFVISCTWNCTSVREISQIVQPKCQTLPVHISPIVGHTDNDACACQSFSKIDQVFGTSVCASGRVRRKVFFAIRRRGSGMQICAQGMACQRSSKNDWPLHGYQPYRRLVSTLVRIRSGVARVVQVQALWTAPMFSSSTLGSNEREHGEIKFGLLWRTIL